ncbi:hypothetical protein NAAC61_02705 [Petrotoga sp. 8T1HF07.NaAc.6.1]|uniref:triose-phosphate isomerase n=1 Tax=Petrotoga sp. 8T1HF07.NaAc.6.1 TaxID=1351838 RepID=UPI00192C26C7|nr:triose-phosphate isomerase [Petrotoga sp. 8T1HF07.NaAc.6.1]MBL5981074.1 hypothetical protein [Petrotoga sp. 8T1HF07.NaAc.6.1]
MKDIYLGTNWKMHKTISETKSYLHDLKNYLKDINFDNIKVFVIPPYTALDITKTILKDSRILYGAQNMHWMDEGEYTGEISPPLLKDFEIDLIELGHSERRRYYNENDIELNKKVKAALKYNFIPLICVGERKEEKKYGVSQEFIKLQIKTILNGVKLNDIEKELNDILWIAYEPVWAIGEKGKPATPEYIEEIHSVIRQTLKKLYNDEISNKIPILYGGSVNQENALSILNQNNVDGLFIGRAAWKANSFSNIIHQVYETFINKNSQKANQ